MTKLQRKSGQAMTEYVIIICVVAIAALLVAGVFGTNIRNLFKSANTSMQAGQAQSTQMQDQGGNSDVRISNFND
jgi:Flp pilus assembly pilin Flp